MVIKKYKSKYRNNLIDICYKTGWSGEDLTGKNIFNDKKSFAMVYVLYYIEHEPDNCFVALENGNVIGYVIGTVNTSNQKEFFRKKIYPKIVLRKIFITSWKYPESVKNLTQLLKTTIASNMDKKILLNYPAHLHINVLKKHQGKGIGSMMLTKFIEHMKQNEIAGIHLGTSSQNQKAISFYKKFGFIKLKESSDKYWDSKEDSISLTFGLAL
jgi:ribosomal protein S18 acetylase RimI-like enzyme